MIIRGLFACAVLAGATPSEAGAQPAPEVPQGRWTGRMECTRAVVICEDLPIVVVIDSRAADGAYHAKLTYLAGGLEYPGETLSFTFNPALHTLTAHNTDFDQHQFWALHLDGDAMNGLRMINTRFTDRMIYLSRDKQK